MPGVALHLLCASRVLQRWHAGVGPTAFNVHDPSVVDAFFQGALGPDMGYFLPGGRLFSDLAHTDRSADLARRLVAEAADELQRAYALGWITHVIADASIHPLVNLAAGEWRHGRPCWVSGGEDLVAHVRVEMGLDGYVRRTQRIPLGTRFARVLTVDRLHFITRAYRDTFGAAIGAPPIATAPERVRRISPILLHWARLHGGGWRRTGQEAAGPAGAASGIRLAHGILSPVAPSPWLLRRVLREVDTFADRYLEHASAGFATLPAVDLDTGVAADSQHGSPPIPLQRTPSHDDGPGPLQAA